MSVSGKNTFILKQRSKVVGLQLRNKSYIIGFKSLTLARKIHYTMHPEPNIRLIQNKIQNVTSSFNKKLDDAGYDSINGEVVIDPDASLIIPKCRGSILEPMNDGMFHLDHMDTGDFLSHPFQKRVGIIMPHSIKLEDDDSLVLSSLVVDPLFDPKFFTVEDL